MSVPRRWVVCLLYIHIGRRYRLGMERERTAKSWTEKLASFIENDAKIQK